jgi:hypothetical protein
MRSSNFQLADGNCLGESRIFTAAFRGLLQEPRAKSQKLKAKG